MMKKHVVILWLISILVVLQWGTRVNGAIDSTERAALIKLYNSSKGYQWLNNTGWKTLPHHIDGFAMPGTENTWYGVTVTGNNVTSLMLNENRLDGSIPSELGNLGELDYLYLQSNILVGDIPVSLLNLTDATVKVRYNALYTDNAGLAAFLDSTDSGWENTQTISPGNITVLPISSTSVRVDWTLIPYTADSGGYRVYYRKEFDTYWALAGITPNKSTATYTVNGLQSGLIYHFTVKTRTYPHTFNSNIVKSEMGISVHTAVGSVPPFGCVDKPIQNDVVHGSIPVSGWALDNFGVQCVKIFREGVESAGETPGELIYVGTADFVEDSRPDVVLAYPDYYPNKNMAGWGYMMLTNLFPNGGNGSFTIHVIAYDVEMNQTTLGTRTITCNNASYVEPFGTIDTPTQGGVASGSQYANYGWVLTQLPNTIPIDGSTISLWIDGIKLPANAIYNLYRADIYNLFPNLNNSNGPACLFFIDTTTYDNGAHIIQWSVTDDGSITRGIGSRFFTAQNRAEENASNQREMSPPFSGFKGDFSKTPGKTGQSVFFRTGYDTSSQLEYADTRGNGNIKIKINALTRIEIHLNDEDSTYYDIESEWMGGLMVDKEWKPLPVGSTLDRDKGVFYWQPCAAFLGNYSLVFYKKLPDNSIIRKKVLIKIEAGTGRE